MEKGLVMNDRYGPTAGAKFSRAELCLPFWATQREMLERRRRKKGGEEMMESRVWRFVTLVVALLAVQAVGPDLASLPRWEKMLIEFSVCVAVCCIGDSIVRLFWKRKDPA